MTEYLKKKGFTVHQGLSGLETAFVAYAGESSSPVTIGICSEVRLARPTISNVGVRILTKT